MTNSRQRKTAIIFHGTDGYPLENWFPALREYLEGRGWNVDVPAFPTPDAHHLKTWKVAFRDQARSNQYDVCIGHSLGVAFALRLLEEGDIKCNCLISVAGAIGPNGIERYDRLNSSFYVEGFDWATIRENLAGSIVIHSDNDPLVPAWQTEALASGLNADQICLREAGHINATAGYTRLPIVEELLAYYEAAFEAGTSSEDAQP